ncbi:MAG: hypothetical protein Q9217_003017 [Psora testacea]
MPSSPRESIRRRLRRSVLETIIKIVPRLLNLRTFRWDVREPMPSPLLDLLQKHQRVIHQETLVTCWGMNEDRRFISDLSMKANLKSLAIEYRPRRNVNLNRLNEITTHHRRLFLDHPALKSLSIDMSYNVEDGVHDITQMRHMEVLPPITFLSLKSYRFEYAWQGLHINLDVRFLQCLTLDSCRRLEFLFYELRIRKAKLMELRLYRPIWREGTLSRERQRSIFQRFLDEQTSLIVLELESIGFSNSILHRPIHGVHCSKLKSLKLQDLDHQLRTTTSGLTTGRAAEFKSLSHEDIREFRLYCPELTTLHVDLAGWDFDPTSIAVKEISQYALLRHCFITTQVHIDYNVLTLDDVYNFAREAWSTRMQSLRITARLINRNSEVGEEVWCVKKEDNHLKAMNETAAKAEKCLVKWSRALNWSVIRYEQPKARMTHMKMLSKNVEKVGNAALAAIGEHDCRSDSTRSRRLQVNSSLQ